MGKLALIRRSTDGDGLAGILLLEVGDGLGDTFGEWGFVDGGNGRAEGGIVKAGGERELDRFLGDLGLGEGGVDVLDKLGDCGDLAAKVEGGGVFKVGLIGGGDELAGNIGGELELHRAGETDFDRFVLDCGKYRFGGVAGEPLVAADAVNGVGA